MLEPKEITIKTLAGNDKKFIISKFPAVAGREIVTQYMPTAVPKIGEYKQNEELMLKLMKFVSAVIDGGESIALENQDLIDNHVPDFETLVQLEIEMFKYNTSFFQEGKMSGFFETLAAKALPKVVQMLTDLLQQSQLADKLHSGS